MTSILISSAAIVAFAAYSEPVTAVVFVGILLVGIAVWAWRKAALRRRGIHVESLMSHLDDDVERELTT